MENVRKCAKKVENVWKCGKNGETWGTIGKERKMWKKVASVGSLLRMDLKSPESTQILVKRTNIVVVSMIQLMSSPWNLRGDLKVATYQALNTIYSK